MPSHRAGIVAGFASVFAVLVVAPIAGAIPGEDMLSPWSQKSLTPFSVDGSSGIVNTVPQGINPAGTVVGYYIDNSGPSFGGFIRDADGAVTTIPNVIADAIAPSGEICGTLRVGTYVQSFVREPDGAMTTFTVPGFSNTTALAIAPSGAILGRCYNSSGPALGYVRSSSGAFSTFDLLPAGSAPVDFNSAGTVIGTLAPRYGFVRSRNGEITPLHISPTDDVTRPRAINEAGTIAGTYEDHDGSTYHFHGFVRSKKGAVTRFDVPDGDADPLCINESGAIAGSVVNTGQAFVRSNRGAITTFTIPDLPFLFPRGISPSGTIAGIGVDAANVQHGFIRTPDGTITTFDVTPPTVVAASMPAAAPTSTPVSHHGAALASARLIDTGGANRTSTLEYSLQAPADVRIDVYDVTGRRMSTLAHDREDAGMHHATWNASGVARGVYFFVLNAGGRAQTRKVVVR